MSSVQIGNRFRLPCAIPQADLLTPVPQDLLAPDSGFLSEIAVVVQVAVTTGGTLTVLNSAGSAVPGLVVAIPNNTPKGTIFVASAVKGALERPVTRNGKVTVAPGGFSGAGAVRCDITVASNDNPQQPY